MSRLPAVHLAVKRAPDVERVYTEDLGGLPIRILHLADARFHYDFALCGKRRDKPLDPGAEGELCVVLRRGARAPQEGPEPVSLATVRPGTPALVFTVEGRAVPSGLRPVPIPGGRGSRLAEGRDKEQEKRIKAWRAEIQRVARETYVGEPLDEALAVEFVFYRKRPDNQVGTGRNAGRVKGWAPRYPTTTPDVLKTARIVEDSLKGIVYADDSLIVEERLAKLFAAPGDPPRVEIIVWLIERAPPLSMTGNAHVTNLTVPQAA